MQHVHTRLLEEPNYQRLSNITELAHFFGPANIFSDAISRGYHLLVSELSAQLRIEVEWIPADLKVLTVLQELRQLARRNALLDEAKASQRKDTGPFGAGVCIGQAKKPGPADGHSPVPFQPPPPASPPRRASVPLVDSSPNYRSPV